MKSENKKWLTFEEAQKIGSELEQNHFSFGYLEEFEFADLIQYCFEMEKQWYENRSEPDENWTGVLYLKFKDERMAEIVGSIAGAFHADEVDYERNGIVRLWWD